MDVGKRIKFFREKRKLTVNRLANMAGVSQSYLRDIELGNKQPTVEYLSYICEALNISLSLFFSDEQTDETLANLIKKLSNDQKQALIKLIESFNVNM
ncbi:MAG: helix-turn-helix transcriptional regulator [Oscillospiraceae bacterium]|nr:helix-turn-helix transcriptional regulator [Oscillospiraceae bacterium]